MTTHNHPLGKGPMAGVQERASTRKANQFPSLSDLVDTMGGTKAPIIVISPTGTVGAYRMDGIDHIFIIEGNPNLSEIPSDIEVNTVVDP
ncbi:MAG: hypothetical protein Q7U20_02130 [Caulobacter sp.]|nr:hypothetical protein [Caulobacter sp.]